MADQVKVNSLQLKNAASILKRDATSTQGYLHEIRNPAPLTATSERLSGGS